MNIAEMHYRVKLKLNKVDTQQYRNLKVPEIDMALNEAMNLFIKRTAHPLQNPTVGFERDQRMIDSLRTIIEERTVLTSTLLTDTDSYTVNIPDDYMFYVSSEVIISKDTCLNVKGHTFVQQHNDRHEVSPFDKSSFEWREVNIRFYEDKIRIFTDGTFTVSELHLDYIRKPAYIHNAIAFQASGYNLFDGTPLTNSQDCELPEITHTEIIDLTVLIISGQIQSPDYQIKLNNLNLNN